MAASYLEQWVSHQAASGAELGAELKRRGVTSDMRSTLRIVNWAYGIWGVENSLHWVLDVVSGEDDSRARSGYAVENPAETRHFAINLLRRDKTCKRSIKAKLLRAAIDPDYLKLIRKSCDALALRQQPC